MTVVPWGASFQGTDGCKYSLFLPVRLNEPPSGNWERLGYDDPVIVDHLAQQDLPISWEHAQIFLSQVRPLIHEEQDTYWFEILSEVVQLRGALPSAARRDLGRTKVDRHG